QQALQVLRGPADEKLRLLSGDREQRLQEARAAALTLTSFEENTRQALRLGLGAVLVALLALGAILIIAGLARMARRGASPRTALVGALALLFGAFVLYTTGGKVLGPGTDTDAADAVAALAARSAGVLPEGPAVVLPRWREFEGLFFAQAA